MKNRTISAVVLILLLLFSVGCSAYKENESEADPMMRIDNFQKYKDSFVGDNSAVGNIISNLDGNQFLNKFALKTENTPYGIEIYYGLNDQSKKDEFDKLWTDKNTKRIVLDNATTLFILVKNVDIVEINVDKLTEQPFSITRAELESFYGRELTVYSEDMKLWKKEVVEDTLNSNTRVSNFFDKQEKIIQ